LLQSLGDGITVGNGFFRTANNLTTALTSLQFQQLLALANLPRGTYLITMDCRLVCTGDRNFGDLQMNIANAVGLAIKLLYLSFLKIMRLRNQLKNSLMRLS
jgi:hypothetical protein